MSSKSEISHDGKVSLKNKLAFAAGDIFGGGTFNLINFLFVPFLTLVIGVPMIWASPLLLLTKVWDGVIDPFIGKITDAKTAGKYGKRRFFMLISAPLVFVGLILLFFPWNLVTNSLPLKIILVVIVYIFYATAQSFVLIPYFSLSSEMTENYQERTRTNAVRMVFSIFSSLICVAVPGMIASPTGSSVTKSLQIEASYGYIIMASIFGLIFMTAILTTAIFAREQVITPPVKKKISFKQFFSPLKLKTYRQYLGMQICTSIGMAIMSSFFFVFCDFVLRRDTYRIATEMGISRFPVATLAAAAMFVAQVFALPFFLKIIKTKGKRFTYILAASVWILLCIAVVFLPSETSTFENGEIVRSVGLPDFAIILLGFLLGFGIGGCVFIPHSSFGDVCDVGQLYFGQRTEGGFSGLTNFLNTTAQAIGLALPALIMGMSAFGGYVETQYLTLQQYNEILVDYGSLEALTHAFKITVVGEVYQLVPLTQSAESQLALRLTFGILPIVFLLVGIFVASRFKLNRQKQEKIVALLNSDLPKDQFDQQRQECLEQLGIQS